MTVRRKLSSWLSWLPWYRRASRDADLARELREHLELEAEDQRDAGLSPKEASNAAHRALGNTLKIEEDVRAAWGFRWLETFAQDLRYGFRMMRKSPGFTAVAVLTLALGIGANTAIFSFIDGILLRSLPVKDPQQLVVLYWSAHSHPKLHGHGDFGDCGFQGGIGDCSLSIPFFKTVRAQSNVFSGMAAFAGPLDYDFSGNGPASMAQGQYVSGDFFSTLGVDTIIGRPLGVSDDSPSAPPAIVLSYAYWQRAFGGDRSVVGRAVRVDNISAVIAGVADPRFTNLTPGNSFDFFMPFSVADRIRSENWRQQDRISDAGIWWAVIVGRLKPGVSLAQAQAAATTMFVNETTHGATPLLNKADAPAIKLLPAAQGLDGESSQIAPMFYLLMFAVGLILLIACANVAGLMLARSATRKREMALRIALGAGRARIVRQLLTESVLLSFVGGVLGILLSLWGINAITALFSSGQEAFPFVIALDWRVLLFTLGVIFAAAILFGLAPARRGSRMDLTPSLKETASSLPGSAAHSGRWFGLGNALVVAQVALSIVLLIGAGLLVRTLRNLQTLNPGFDTRNILLFGINPTAAGYSAQKTAQLYSDLQQRFAALPGVSSASYSEDALLSGDWSSDPMHVDGAPPRQNVDTAELTVGLNFFSTMRIPLLAGRAFNSADFAAASAIDAATVAAEQAASKAKASGAASTVAASSPASSKANFAPLPVIINESFARECFPNQNPLGKHFSDSQDENEPSIGPHPGYLIVGIAGDTKYAHLRDEIEPTMYMPLVRNSAHFALRTAADPLALVKLVHGIVSSADDNLPLFDVRTQTEQVEQTLYLERLISQISSAFAMLALVLACIGLYGLLSYEVARRTRELGIRMALGAQRRDLLRLVVGQGISLVFIGAAIGIAAALGVTRFMSAVLYGVHADDPLTFAGVVILLALVALAACYIPARRAMKVDPMVALRYE
ncbi:MAG TPA: ABC transporter permease [Candidatus Acidoferrales bacterium]|nr:ABC transporter permease [Candidatus Acidoferrales bacterium]